MIFAYESKIHSIYPNPRYCLNSVYSIVSYVHKLRGHGDKEIDYVD